MLGRAIFGQAADFAGVVHGHFEDGYLGIRGNAQDGEWKAYVIVRFPMVFATGTPASGWLGTSRRLVLLTASMEAMMSLVVVFSGAASHAHHLEAPLIARPGGNFLERGQKSRERGECQRCLRDSQLPLPRLFEMLPPGTHSHRDLVLAMQRIGLQVERSANRHSSR